MATATGRAPVTIGIIGVGKIAIDQHIPALISNPAFDLKATSNLVPVAVDGATSYSDYRDLLADTAIEAVAICTPPQVRTQIARASIAHGKHVLIEKPPAATLSELVDLAGAAARAGVTLFTAWHSQYNRAVEVAAKTLAGQEVTSLAVSWKEDVRHWHPGQTWIWRAGGFGVFDPGINALSILTRILPEPLVIAAADMEFPSNCDAPIAARLTFAGADGRAGRDLGAVFDFRQTGPQTWDIAIETRNGSSLVLSSGGTRLTIDGTLAIDEAPREYPMIYATFADLIAGGASHVDDAPFRLVADAFMLARRTTVEPFYD